MTIGTCSEGIGIFLGASSKGFLDILFIVVAQYPVKNRRFFRKRQILMSFCFEKISQLYPHSSWTQTKKTPEEFLFKYRLETSVPPKRECVLHYRMLPCKSRKLKRSAILKAFVVKVACCYDLFFRILTIFRP